MAAIQNTEITSVCTPKAPERGALHGHSLSKPNGQSTTSGMGTAQSTRREAERDHKGRVARSRQKVTANWHQAKRTEKDISMECCPRISECCL